MSALRRTNCNTKFPQKVWERSGHARFVQSYLLFLIFIMINAVVVPEAALAKIIVLNSTLRQGETFEVKVEKNDHSHISFMDKSYRLFPNRSTYTYDSALLAVPADLKPGRYTLSCGSEDQMLTVVPGKFPMQRISLPPAKDNFKMSPGEKEAVDKAKATLTEKRLWRGRFMPPSNARISTRFGLKRIVNGHLLPDYFHAGLDYAAALNSPVRACASGNVVLVGHNFRLHGNTVAIDHGQGVISFYIHLQKILVKPGDNVAIGAQIATVGQTGRATGPHLHYGLYVNQVATNPEQWFKNVF